MQSGITVELLAHSTSDFTIAQWGWALDEWQRMGVTVTSRQLYAAYIRANTPTLWQTSDSCVYTRTFGNTEADYHLGPNSALIGKGSATACPRTTLDYDGKLFWGDRGAPPIGAYANPRGAGD